MLLIRLCGANRYVLNSLSDTKPCGVQWFEVYKYTVAPNHERAMARVRLLWGIGCRICYPVPLLHLTRRVFVPSREL